MGLYGRMAAGADVPKQHTKESKQQVPDQTNTAILQQSNTAINDASRKQDIMSLPVPANEDEVIQVLRKSLMQVGDKPHSCRFEASEKRALKDMVYEMDNEGFKCDANKIIRAGLNYLIIDHKKNGQEGILYRLLDSLSK